MNTSQMAGILVEDEYANFSYSGAKALIEYLEDLEEDMGEEMEFDKVAIRCEFSQYDSLMDWAKEYFTDWKKDLDIEDDMEEDEVDEIIREHIQDHGPLIEFDSGIIVGEF